MKVGVLALQGAFIEHAEILSKIGVQVTQVRLPEDLKQISALIIPGGESTTISKLMTDYGILKPLKDFIQSGMPLLGTCAGLILLANRIVEDHRVNGIGILDITVRRNAYGRQVNSFEADLDIPVLGEEKFRGIFIRAPQIESVSSNVEVLANFNNTPVAIKQKNIIACTFHPELTSDLRFHRYFVSLIEGN